LANVLENFYFYDTEEEAFHAAKDALAMYLGGSRRKVQWK
jgi:predicted RNase H-like HicB family nuclease